MERPGDPTPRLHISDSGGSDAGPPPIKFPAPISTPRDDDPRADALLVGLASRGDEEAFLALYRRHRSFVVSVARRYTRDESEALDVLQDTFAYLVKKLPTLRLTSKLSTFLYPAVRNIALTIRRKDRMVALSPTHDTAGKASTASPEIGPRPIEKVVVDLPEGQREVLLLRFVNDLSLREIAAVLSIPIGTVKSRLHQAIATLREDPKTRELFDGEPPPPTTPTPPTIPSESRHPPSR
ncbi:MAG: sigma-70 family RNA polymerase sigma factor [Phycisphaeraceae bacterium]|nr:sigma-70 family RNA polymerase sigma factor [Phycisphaeraceae bacterium]